MLFRYRTSQERNAFINSVYTNLETLYFRHHVVVYKDTPKHELDLKARGLYIKRAIPVAEKTVTIVVFSHGSLTASKCIKGKRLKYSGEKKPGIG